MFLLKLKFILCKCVVSWEDIFSNKFNYTLNKFITVLFCVFRVAVSFARCPFTGLTIVRGARNMKKLISKFCLIHV